MGRRGPTDRAVEINSFGGLSLDSPMSYAVRDFYLNGGSDAVIIRLFHSVARDAAHATAAAVGNGNTAQAVATSISNKAGEFTKEPAKSAAAAAAEAANDAAGQVGADPASVQEAAEKAAAKTPTERARLSVGGLKLAASSEGLWGTNRRVVVDEDNISDDAAAALGVPASDI